MIWRLKGNCKAKIADRTLSERDKIAELELENSQLRQLVIDLLGWEERETGVVQLASGRNKSPTQAEVGGLMVHPAARGFGIASLLVKVMMVYAVKESGRDAPDEQYLAHVVDGRALWGRPR
jgi:predicted GNAT family acetyltransferase